MDGSQNPMDIRFSSSDVEDYDTSADEDLGYNSSSDEEVDFLDNEYMLAIVGVHVYGSAGMNVGIYLSHVIVFGNINTSKLFV